MATRTIQLSDGSSMTVDIAHADEIAAKLTAAAQEEKRKSHRAQRIRNTVEDLGGRLLYYGRKEDDELPVFAIEDAIIAGEIGIDEMISILEKQLRASVLRRRENPNEVY